MDLRSKRYIGVLSVATVLLMVLAGFAAMPGTAGDSQRVIVFFDEEVDESVVKDLGGKVERTLTSMPAIIATVKSKDIKDIKANSAVDVVAKDVKAKVIQVKPTDPGKPDKPDKPGKPGGGNDPPEELPWGVDEIDADLLWSDNTGTGIKVAVLDTGIDYRHTELRGAYAGGYDFVNDDSRPMDDHGHGTHCAGIIAAAHNDVGVMGVAPDVSLYAVKVIDRFGYGSYLDAIAGIDWSIDNEINVISMSLGWRKGTGPYNLDDDAIAAFDAACIRAESADITMVVAAGNSGTSDTSADNILYPARFSSVVSVAAVNSDLERAGFSATGPDQDISGPGVGVKSTVLKGKYAVWDGTSMACPHVAGTVALVLTTTPPVGGWTVSNMKVALYSTADDLGDESRDDVYGWGLVDAEEAVTGSETP